MALGSFTIAAVVLIVLPGPDTLVVVRSMVRDGRGGGTRAAAGVLCGLIVWVGAASAGLSALLQASRIGYAALEIVGACYLIWMGVGSLRSLLRTASDVESDAATVRPADRRSGFAAGFLTDLLNPKIGVLFVGLLPGFVPHGYSVGWTTLGFGVLYIAVTALYFAGLVAAAGTVATWMRAPRVRRRLDAAAGLVLVGFGLRLALDA